MKTHAIGVNFIDTYHRSGLYPLGDFPLRLGQEGAGIVEDVGMNVTHVKPGDRVAWGNGVPGSYAEVLNAPAGRLGETARAASGSMSRRAAAMLNA